MNETAAPTVAEEDFPIWKANKNRTWVPHCPFLQILALFCDRLASPFWSAFHVFAINPVFIWGGVISYLYAIGCASFFTVPLHVQNWRRIQYFGQHGFYKLITILGRKCNNNLDLCTYTYLLLYYYVIIIMAVRWSRWRIARRKTGRREYITEKKGGRRKSRGQLGRNHSWVRPFPRFTATPNSSSYTFSPELIRLRWHLFLLRFVDQRHYYRHETPS